MKGVLVKLTDSEVDLLDLLVERGEYDSRAAALRGGIVHAAYRAGLAYSVQKALADGMSERRRRRSRTVIDRQAERGKDD